MPVVGELLALDDVDGGLRQRGRELPHVLEHRHRLPARDDVLDALRRRVLAAQRDRVQLVRLERRRRPRSRGRRSPPRRASILLPVLISICSKIVPAFWLSQPGTNCSGPLERAALVQRLQDRVVPALEQERVRILLAAVQLGDDRSPASFPSGRRDAVALQHADRVAVERGVEDGGAALDLAVVVDRLDALRGGRLLDRRCRAGVDRSDDQDLRAVGDALVGLRLLLLRVALRVDDARRDVAALKAL